MKILFSAPGYKPAWRIGGPIVSISSLAEALVQRGHEVTVFATNSNFDVDLDVATDRPVELNGVNVHYFRHIEPLKRLFPRVSYLAKSLGVLYSPDMRRALARQASEFDVIHSHMPYIYPTFAAARAAFRTGRPLFYHQRGAFDPEQLKFRSVKKRVYITCIERPILRRATTLIALTEAERDNYSALGVTTPCRVIPNGIDLRAPMDRMQVRALCGTLRIRDHHRVILFLGRLHPIKGADRLLHAFEQVASRFPDALLVLAGPDEFGIERDFRTRVSDAGLAERVLFPGMVQGDLKSALLHRAELFCLPSQAEGFSMAILEALAHSTAVLISPRCHFPDVETFHAGRIASAAGDSFTSALADMLAHPDRLIAMGDAGRALVAERYTWRSVSAAMIDAYEEGIDRHRMNASGVPLHRG